MNIPIVKTFLEEAGIRQGIMLVYILIALSLACYNWLYLYHSLHVSSRHMGLNAPLYIKQTIKISIFLAVSTAGLCLLLLLIGLY